MLGQKNQAVVSFTVAAMSRCDMDEEYHKWYADNSLERAVWVSQQKYRKEFYIEQTEERNIQIYSR